MNEEQMSNSMHPFSLPGPSGAEWALTARGWQTRNVHFPGAIKKVKRESDITGKPIPHGINSTSFAAREANGKTGV